MGWWNSLEASLDQSCEERAKVHKKGPHHSWALLRPAQWYSLRQCWGHWLRHRGGRLAKALLTLRKAHAHCRNEPWRHRSRPIDCQVTSWTTWWLDRGRFARPWKRKHFLLFIEDRYGTIGRSTCRCFWSHWSKELGLNQIWDISWWCATFTTKKPGERIGLKSRFCT